MCSSDLGARRVVTLALEGVGGAAIVPVVGMPVVTAPQRDGEQAALPVVFSGVLSAPRARALHRFGATKDVPLALLVEGIGIGLETDPLLSVEDQEGKRLAATDDPAGRLSWKAPADGVYTAVVRDRRGQAGPSHGYRLSIRPALPEARLASAVDRVTGEAGKPIEVAISIDRLHGFSAPIDLVLTAIIGFALAIPAIGGGEALVRAAHELPPPRVQPMQRTAWLTVLFAVSVKIGRAHV